MKGEIRVADVVIRYYIKEKRATRHKAIEIAKALHNAGLKVKISMPEL